MKKNPFRSIRRAGLLAAGIAIAWGATAPATPFDDRAKETIDFYANQSAETNGSPKYIFFYAEARFRDYQRGLAAGVSNTAQLAKAREYVRWGFNNLGNTNDPSFALWRAVDCYLRYSNYFTPDLKTLAKTKLLASQLYGNHDTENKRWMAATARFLVSEIWPGQDGATGSYAPGDPTGWWELMNMMISYTHQGETEHNSPTYFAMHYGSLRTLADFAKDLIIANRAFTVAEWLLISAAGEWMDGFWCAATERAYDYTNLRPQNRYGAATSTFRLLFGGPRPINWTDGNWAQEIIDCVQSACSSYRVPAIILQLAGDKGRTTPFIHRESHRRNGSYPTEFCLTTAIHGDYALYSQHEYFRLGWFLGGGMDMVVRWAVNFRRTFGYGTFFVQHYNGTKTPLMGSTEYEQVLHSGSLNTGQGKALIGVWNKPERDIITTDPLTGAQFHSTNPVLGWVPANPVAYINDATNKGNIFLHYGTVMIALHITKTFPWTPNGASQRFTINDKPSNNRFGMVVEVTRPNNYSGSTEAAQLAAFKTAFTNNLAINRIVTKTDATSTLGKGITLEYKALDGTRMKTSLRLYNSGDHVISSNTGSDYINNQEVRYELSSWPLLKDPFVYQCFFSNTLTLSNGISGAGRKYLFSGEYKMWWGWTPFP